MSTSSEPSRSARQVQIAIVGGGLSGSLAAAVLGRAGYRVALIDRNESYPAEFRVEKIAGDQVDILRRLDMLDELAKVSTPFDEIVNVRNGRIIDRSIAPHFGILYEDLVKFARARIPQSVEFIVGRVVDLKTGADRQSVVLADGETIEADLVVLATGMGDVLRYRIGIRRQVVAEKQSISFGFTLTPGEGERFEFPALTYYGERLLDRIDYLSLFPIGSAMRANLFTFRDHTDPWIRDLRQNPKQALFDVMPGLQRYLGDFKVTDKVQNWVMDLSVVDGHRQAGVVLIGDAFQTSCPAAGTGVSRLLTDIERLCGTHLPRWFKTPGMPAKKIAQFYDDHIKEDVDARAAYLAEYRRSLTIDPGLRWEMHRRQVYLRRRVIGWIDRINPGWISRARAGQFRRPRTAARQSAGSKR